MKSLRFTFVFSTLLVMSSFAQNIQRNFIPEFLSEMNPSNVFRVEIPKTDLLLDSVLTNSLMGSSTKDVFSYNESGRLILHEMFYGDKSNWQARVRIAFTYNDNDKINQILHQFFNGVTWTNDMRETREYDGEGRYLLITREGWEEGNWVEKFQSIYSYDDVNNIVTEVSQNWQDGEWVNQFRFTNTYIGDSHLRDQMLIETWEGATWVEEFLSTFIYDENNNLTEILRQSKENGDWVNSLKVLYKNGSDKEKYILTQIFSGDEWLNDSRTTESYNENDLLIHLFNETWNGGNWEAADGFVTISFDFGYSFGYIGANSADFYYGPVTSVDDGGDDLPSGFELKQNYPNPFSKSGNGNSSTTIGFSLPERSFVTLKIYDALGREVAVLVNEEKYAGEYRVAFNANAKLSAGVYFYRLEIGSYAQTRKMILTK